MYFEKFFLSIQLKTDLSIKKRVNEIGQKIHF